MHCLKDGPVAAVIMANIVANVASLMSGATVLLMGSLAIGAKASIISKLSVIQRLQPRRDRALTEARSHSRRDRRRKVRTTGFLALQFIVKWLKAPTLRVRCKPHGGAVY